MKRRIAIACLGLALVGCETNELSVPLPIGGGGTAAGYYTPAQSAPMVPYGAEVSLYRDYDPYTEQRETHGVVSPEDCYTMETKLQLTRRVRLSEILRNRSGGDLEYVCAFEGDDAEAGWSFQEKRWRN
ncbi:MAG TPA: hypothetical protein V6C63_12225 [Allocoleopsis sp.]